MNVFLLWLYRHHVIIPSRIFSRENWRYWIGVLKMRIMITITYRFTYYLDTVNFFLVRHFYHPFSDFLR